MASLPGPALPARPRCFFDITIGGKAAGRVVFELYHDIAPKTGASHSLP